jgi:hypothetical protein
MTNMVLVENKDEKYWETGFVADQSIQRVKHVEGKALGAKVLCGLELWRAKLNLGHSTWYPYLIKCGISPPTASRRKTIAVEFLLWAHILEEGSEIGLDHIIQGLALIDAKPFNLNDFAHHILAQHDDAFLGTFLPSQGGPVTRRSLTEKRLGFDSGRVFNGLKSIRNRYGKWSGASRLQVKETLQVLRQYIDVVISELSEREV